jgi:hypothetical protein
MGIYIIGKLLPQELTPKQWERVYEEALQLVNAYDFLDIVQNNDKYAKYGLIWSYAEKSKERDIDGHLGVGIYGAYAGCISAEDQFLYRDLNRYLPKKRNTDEFIRPDPNALRCHDALIGRFYDNEGLEEYQDHQDTIFGSKTQGYPHHVPLLAIGLLLENRLGKAFTVYGDITRGQIKAAVEWANTILDKPISWPCVMDNAQLLVRLQAFVPKTRQIEAFLRFTFCTVDEAMYRFLQRHFSEEELTDYWRKEISDCIPGTIGSGDFFKKYFNMTGDLRLLTKVCSAKYTPEEFADELASSRVFEREKNINNPVATLSSDSDRETPETIETVMGKIFALLGGGFPRNSAVERYIPLEQGVRDISIAYGDAGESGLDFESLLRSSIKEAAPKSEEVSESLEILDKLVDEIQEQTEQTDISDSENLVFYKPGDIIEPEIKTNLKGIREFVDAHKKDAAKEYLKTYADEESTDKKFIRMAVIVERCTRLLPKSIWDMFEQKIEGDDFFFTLLGLHVLKSDTLPISYYVKGLLYNPDLFARVLLSDDIDWLNDKSRTG